MLDPRTAIVAGGLLLTLVSVGVMLLDDVRAVSSLAAKRAASWLRPESVRVALAQAGLTSIPVPLWILGSAGIALLAAVVTWLWFGIPVLGLVAFLVVHHLIGTALEFRRRGSEASRQEALLEAVRHGVAVMSRAGNATQMLEALAESGPFEVRQLFGEMAAAGRQGPGGVAFVGALERMREQVADPLFDDVILALSLHFSQGGKLVPALEAVAGDWAETLRLQREAKALRSGIEASVVLLALLPFVFLVTLQLLAPALLAPFRSAAGEVVFGMAVAWMALGYGVLQRMSQPPRETRLKLRETGA